MTPKPRTLLLTLDAFETIFHPRQPVPDQYASAAHAFGLPKTVITSERIQAAFKSVFKAQSKARPNYGRADVLLGQYNGPRQWWEEIIRGSFSRVIAEHNSHSNRNAQIDVPEGLIGHLLDRFASREGYALYEDAGPFFARMAEAKAKGLGPFERVLLGVISNSDDRVPAVLRSLGLVVGGCRADEGVESGRLPGFEERSAAERVSAIDRVKDVDLVVTSYEAGVEKPSPRIFEVAGRQARALVGAGASEEWTCMHVGDDLEKDYRAAVGAGWDGYFLARRDEARDLDGVRAIRSLEDLITVLEGYR
ncbi:uncharacterized protein BDW43DRAFT_92604 [Aspergillus alliaceus]|uniref:uncharacterized protein n=1 Tax=Petromyces alliaceus TaxID=209559 RepID=UPI0012A7078B|nr:uncharacterized protein BDW43DRAFT_92604 [Aspergillus alliaceus]KAB8233043.1 hypothetical protein BDW43DRAFT_92604 [Aspergillus alliaceus]